MVTTECLWLVDDGRKEPERTAGFGEADLQSQVHEIQVSEQPLRSA
jgi:hypothetical protein